MGTLVTSVLKHMPHQRILLYVFIRQTANMKLQTVVATEIFLNISWNVTESDGLLSDQMQLMSQS